MGHPFFSFFSSYSDFNCFFVFSHIMLYTSRPGFCLVAWFTCTEYSSLSLNSVNLFSALVLLSVCMIRAQLIVCYQFQVACGFINFSPSWSKDAASYRNVAKTVLVCQKSSFVDHLYTWCVCGVKATYKPTFHAGLQLSLHFIAFCW